MIIRRLDRRRRKESLADAILALASRLNEAPSPASALDTLGQGLAAKDVPYALLSGASGRTFRIERATLPFATGIWGNDVALPKLTGTLSRGKAFVLKTADAFSSGGERLLAGAAPESLVVAPAGSGMLLCLSFA
jgi:hypothetical protein